jgi:outer membrane biosynthesis protein TonB
MFFESMHCLFCNDRQQTTPTTTEDRRQPPPSCAKKGTRKKAPKKKKAPTITEEEEATSPQQNNKEEQKEEEKQDENSNTAIATGITNVKDSDSSKEKGSSVEDRGILRYWYYLAHTLKSVVWRKSMDRRKFDL